MWTDGSEKLARDVTGGDGIVVPDGLQVAGQARSKFQPSLIITCSFDLVWVLTTFGKFTKRSTESFVMGSSLGPKCQQKYGN